MPYYLEHKAFFPFLRLQMLLPTQEELPYFPLLINRIEDDDYEF
jgi:hypothetical protein